MANKMADKKKNTSQSQMAEPKARASEKDKDLSKTKAVAREQSEPKRKPARREVKEQERKPVRRETKGQPSTMARLRSNRLIRFLLDAYYELRHKVTWPTFEEARNMTVVVILLSAAIAAVLFVADTGLFQLFKLITGR